MASINPAVGVKATNPTTSTVESGGTGNFRFTNLEQLLNS